MQRTLNTLTAIVLTAGMTLTGTASAQNNCASPGNSFEDVYCLVKVFVKADDDLNVAYQRLIRRLAPNDQNVLRRTQRAWVAARNASCTASDSTQGSVIYIGCAVDRTTARTNFLNDRYRECVSSGCRPAKLNE